MNYPTFINNILLNNILYNASGVYCTTLDQYLTIIKNEHVGAFVTKSCTLQKNKGNEYPKYYFKNKEYSINANGLENNGIEYYSKFPDQNKPIFYSITSIDCLKFLPENANIELNFSCPNIGNCNEFSPQFLDGMLANITYKNIGIKLPPIFSNFDEYCQIFKKYNIKFIVCINSIPNGLDIDIDNEMSVINANHGFGGFGGRAILPIALANVRKFWLASRKLDLNIDIIGCGGVADGKDVFKYLLAGACAVQIGTILFNEGTTCFKRIMIEFDEIMKRKGYINVNEIIGKLKSSN